MTIALDQVSGRRAITALWPEIEPLLRSAFRACGRDMDADFIFDEAVARRRQLWAIYETLAPLPLMAAMMSRIVGGVVSIDALGGRDMRAWLPTVQREFERMAKRNGMAAVEITGRFGWARILPDYRPARVTIRKEF